MKKYFLVETEDQIEFGDVVNLTFCKELEDGRITVERDVEFSEDTMDVLIELGFVVEREVEVSEEEENPELLDFDEQESQEAWQELIETVEDHDGRIESLESMVKSLKATVLNIEKALKKANVKPVKGDE